MSKIIGFRNVATAMTALTLAPAAEVSALGLLNGDQDDLQDPAEGPEENPIIDPSKKFGPDRKRNQNRLNDSGINARCRGTDSRSA